MAVAARSPYKEHCGQLLLHQYKKLRLGAFSFRLPGLTFAA